MGRTGAAHQTVMWYAVDGDEVLFNTTRDRVKTSNVARDPRVSLIVSEGYSFVRVTGSARETATGEEALRDIVMLAVRYGGTEDRARRQFSRDERVSYRFAIERVYSSADLRE